MNSPAGRTDIKSPGPAGLSSGQKQKVLVILCSNWPRTLRTPWTGKFQSQGKTRHSRVKAKLFSSSL